MTEPEFVRATRASYDAVAADYARWVAGELAARPLDRAMLAGFAELVRSGGNRPVADIGCRAVAHAEAAWQDLVAVGRNVGGQRRAGGRDQDVGYGHVGSLIAVPRPGPARPFSLAEGGMPPLIHRGTGRSARGRPRVCSRGSRTLACLTWLRTGDGT